MDAPDSPTLASLLDELVAWRGTETALIDEFRSVNYEELRSRADRLAAGLRANGISSDDRVALLMENRIEWVEAMFATMRLGATVVAMSTWAETRELEYYLSHSDATAVVAIDEFAGNDYAEALDEILEYQSDPVGETDSDVAPDLDTVILHGTDRPGALQFDTLFSDEPIPFETDPNDPDDTACLLYTSGSTSKPKGVPLLQGGIIENGYHIGERMHLTTEDRVWVASPLFWSYGIANSLCAHLTHGASVVLQQTFDPEMAVELITEHDCTVYYGMPNMARDMVDADNFDAEKLNFRTGTTIGVPENVEFTMDELDIPELCNVYGSTETYGNCAVTDCKLPREVRINKQGRPLPGQDIVIKDPGNGEELPEGKVGEIRVGGRITPGYYDNPEKNEASFDEDGYLKMGDLGCLDEDGLIQFRGRLKNIIKTGGVNVSPVEVEEFILELEAVEQAFVVGLDDEERGEIVAAVVIPDPDASLTEDQIRDHCEGLAGYKRPKRITVVSMDQLPKTDTGKIKRQQLTGAFEE